MGAGVLADTGKGAGGCEGSSMMPPNCSSYLTTSFKSYIIKFFHYFSKYIKIYCSSHHKIL